MFNEGIPKETVPESEFNERLRQLKTIWRISPEIFNNLMEEFGQFAMGESKNDRIERIYKGWSKEDIERLENTITDFTNAQPAREKMPVDDLSTLSEYEGFKVGDKIKIEIKNSGLSFGLDAEISSFGRDNRGRAVVYCSNFGQEPVLISEILKKEN